MVYDLLVTKMDKDQEIVLDETLLAALCSDFGMSKLNILATLGTLEESGRLQRRVRKMEDLGIRLLVNGSHFAPLAPALIPVPVHQPVLASQVTEPADSVDAISAHAATLNTLLKTEIRRADEVIKEAEYRRNRAHELLHAIRDFIET